MPTIPTGSATPEDPPRIAAVTQVLAALPLAEVVDAFAGAGLGGIEPTIGTGGHLPAREGPETRAAAASIDASPLELCGLAATAALPLGSDELAGASGVAAAMGAPFVRVFCRTFDATRAADAQLEAASRALARLCEFTPPAVHILIEPAPGTVAGSPELARRIVAGAQVARAGIVYDPGSLVPDGHLQPAIAVALLGALIRHVHVKNQLVERVDGLWITRPAALGEGIVDWPAALESLARIGYADWLSVDHLPHRSDAASLELQCAELAAMAVAAGRDVPELTR
jgi:sugar phosphate isomerase/epimerase